MTYEIEVRKGHPEIFTQQFLTFKVHHSTSLSSQRFWNINFLPLSSFECTNTNWLRFQWIPWAAKVNPCQKYLWKSCSAICKFCFSFSWGCLDFLAALKAFQSTSLQYISRCMSTYPPTPPNLPSLLVSVYWACSTLGWLHTQCHSAESSI